MKKAVITGDIIQSKRIVNKPVFLEKLTHIFNETEAKFKFDNPFEIFRGDSFQAVLKHPKYALRVALIVQSGLIAHSSENEKWQTRVAVGIGKISFENQDVKLANGTAFELSGQALDAMKNKPVKLIISTDNQKKNSLLTTFNRLLETITDRWTKNAAEVVYYSLLFNFTQKELAQKLGVSQSAVQQRLTSAHYDAVNHYIEYYETEIYR